MGLERIAAGILWATAYHPYFRHNIQPSTGHLAIFFNFVCVLGWVVLISLKEGWLRKANWVYSLDVGLWEVSIGPGVALGIGGGVISEILPEEYTNKLKAMFHTSVTIQEFREYVCSISNILPHACEPWNMVQISTWILLTTTILALIFLVVAGLLDAYRRYIHARAQTRKWVRALYAIGPVVLTMGLVQYALLARQIKDMPPKDSNSEAYGENMMIALFLTAIAWLPLLIFHCAGGASLEEVLNENASADRKFMKEQEGYAIELAQMQNQQQGGPCGPSNPGASFPGGAFPGGVPGPAAMPSQATYGQGSPYGGYGYGAQPMQAPLQGAAHW